MSHDTPVLGFENVAVQNEGVSQVHCVPVNDLNLHHLCETCACRPEEDGTHPDYWMHNAFDGREAHYERGVRMH